MRRPDLRLTAVLAAVGWLFAARVSAAPPTEHTVRAADATAGCLTDIADVPEAEICKLTAYGRIGAVGGRSFSYALYQYQLRDGPVVDMRAVVFEQVAPDRLRVLFVPDSDGATFEAPRLVRTRAGLLLHVPGSESGTGNFNRERLYIWHHAHWRSIDATSWLKTLAQRLPKGLGAWKGIYPNYATMRAHTPLWRDSDGNCCPTGGSADIRLAWSGDKISFAGVHVHHGRSE